MRYRKRRLWLLKQKHIRIVIIVISVVVVLSVIFAVLSALGKKAETSDAVNSVLSKGMINIGLRSDLGSICSYNAQTSEFEGYEKDVADEIVNRLFKEGIIVNYIEVNSKTKSAMLRRGDIDLALTASIGIKSSGINFTSSYYSDASAVLVANDHIENIRGLEGGTVAVIYGTPQAQDIGNDIIKLEEYFNSIDIVVNIKTYASYPEAVAALQNGFIDGVCAGENMLKLFGKKGMILLPDYFMPNEYCVEVSDKLGAFYRAVDAIINEMKQDGTFDELMIKWKLTNYALVIDQN